jgi:hypothetical protein
MEATTPNRKRGADEGKLDPKSSNARRASKFRVNRRWRSAKESKKRGFRLPGTRQHQKWAVSEWRRKEREAFGLVGGSQGLD